MRCASLGISALGPTLTMRSPRTTIVVFGMVCIVSESKSRAFVMAIAAGRFVSRFAISSPRLRSASSDAAISFGIELSYPSRITELHELALAKSQDRHTDPQQLSFICGSLSDLKGFWEKIKANNIKVNHVTNHVNAFGCYFQDPEENNVEVYWHTGRDYPQPCGLPLDLDMSEEELLAMNAAVPDKEPVAAN